MTDTPTQEVVVNTAPTPLPKQTTPDDLLKMYDEEVVDSKKEIETEAEKQVAIKEEVPKVEAAKKLAKTTEDKEQAKVEKENDREQAKEEIKEAIKAFKAKFGDKEIEVPEDATFTVTINGKEVEFKTKDAIQAFQGKEEFNRNMDRRVGAVTAKEREWKRQMDSLRETATKVIDSAIGGDMFAATKTLAKLAAAGTKLDPSQFEKAYLDQIEKFYDAYAKMTPEQRDKFLLERRVKLQEEENRTLKETQARNEARAQLAAKLDSLYKQHATTPEEFWDTYKSMAENLVGEDKPWKSPNDIQPEDVIRQLTLSRQYERVEEAAEKVNLTDEDKIDAVFELTKQYPEWGVDDIVKVITKSGIVNAVPKEVENLNRKAEKSGIKTQLSTVSSTEKKNGKVAGVYDKDEWEWLTRHQPKVYRPAFR